MSRRGIDRKLAAETGSRSNLIDDKPTDRGAINTLCDANEPSKSTAPPPYKMGNSDLIVDKTSRDRPVHAGPQSIVKEPIYLEGIKRRDVMNNIDDMCKDCVRKQEKSIEGKLKKIKKNWTINKCYLSATITILIEIIFLPIYYYTFAEGTNVCSDFINPLTIEIMHNNLERFRPRNEWIPGSNPYEYPSNCSYQCPKLKSKVRFTLMPLCHSDIFHPSKNLNLSENGDVYFNYFITEQRRLGVFEGRPLMCPFKGPYFSKEDHSSIITFGIKYCYAGRSKWNSYSSLNQVDMISDFITNLIKKKMLTQDYVLEFPDICEGSYLLERVKRVPDAIKPDHISFYKQDVYRNSKISTEINSTTISSLLFLPKGAGTLENDKISIFPLESQSAFPSYTAQDNYLPSKTVDKITIRFYILKPGSLDLRKPMDWTSSGKFVQESWPEIANYFGKEIPVLNSSIGNYFIPLMTDEDQQTHLYEHIPVNYSSNLNGNDIILNVFLMNYVDKSIFNSGEILVLRLARALAILRDHIWKRIKYSRVDFAIFCRFVTLDEEQIREIYLYSVDTALLFFRYDESGRFIDEEYCLF